tara:strand:- start:129 stop:767 length:639 start_codon:yes stop_codon:yes gene_type:complete
MASNTIKKVNIDDLPINSDVSTTDYFLVQGPDHTFRIKFGDIIIGKENTTFGQEINELYSRVGALEKTTTATEEKITDSTTVDNKISTVTSQIGALDAKLTAKINNVSDAAADASAMQNQLNKMNTDLNTARAETSNLKTLIATHVTSGKKNPLLHEQSTLERVEARLGITTDEENVPLPSPALYGLKGTRPGITIEEWLGNIEGRLRTLEK